jgi:alpha-galactosidase
MKVFLVLFLIYFSAYSLDNGEGVTPPMGWNSWNHFGCKINETLIRKTADLLVSTGLAAKGYKYVNLDDCWQVSRNSTTQ